MIVDRLDRADAYRQLGPRIAAGLDYLKATDFTNVEDGKHELDGENLFAMVQRYKTRSESQVIWEAHRDYLDIQYIAEGAERLGYYDLSLKPKITKPYGELKDAELYDAPGDYVTLTTGMFVIFAPHDVHAPGLAAGSPPLPAPAMKVVVKVKLDGGMFA